MKRMQAAALAMFAVLLITGASALSARTNNQVQAPTPPIPLTLTAPADTTEGCDLEDEEEDDDDRADVKEAGRTGAEIKDVDNDEHEHHCGKNDDDDGEEDDDLSGLHATSAHKG